MDFRGGEHQTVTEKIRKYQVDSPYENDSDNPKFMEGSEDETIDNENSNETCSGSVSSPLAGKIYGTMEDLEKVVQKEVLINNELGECIQNCLGCYVVCAETFTRCLKLGGKHSEREQINLLFDCAKICNINADFMLRNSTRYPQICSLTANICNECSGECDKFEEGFMKECARVCRRCAESCREMVK